MEDEVIKIITDYGVASNELAAKIALEIGGIYSENYVNVRIKDYLEKSLVYMHSYVKTMDRDSVDRKQLSHLITEAEEYLKNS